MTKPDIKNASEPVRVITTVPTNHPKNSVMNETVVVSHEERLELHDGPVGLKTVTFFKNQNDIVFIRMIFKNISEKNITAMKISIEGKDPFDTLCDSIPSYSFIDMDVLPGDFFGNDRIVVMNSGISRKADIHVDIVAFKDETIWKNEGSEWIRSEDPSKWDFHEETIEVIGIEEKTSFSIERVKELGSAKEVLEYVINSPLADEDKLIKDIQVTVENENSLFYGNQKYKAIRLVEDHLKENE